MSEPDFLTLLQPLFDEYGRKHYGPERCRKIWLAFKGEPKEWIKRVVDAAFETEREAPMKKHLLRISADLREADRRAAMLLEREQDLEETPEQHAARVAENARKAAETAEELRRRAHEKEAMKEVS